MNFFERLKNIQHKFESGDTPPEIIQTLNANVDRLIANNVVQNALSVGDTAPLDLMVQMDTEVNLLKNLLEDRFLVLTWFRGNW